MVPSNELPRGREVTSMVLNSGKFCDISQTPLDTGSNSSDEFKKEKENSSKRRRKSEFITEKNLPVPPST
jgi:hypothetical protein